MDFCTVIINQILFQGISQPKVKIEDTCRKAVVCINSDSESCGRKSCMRMCVQAQQCLCLHMHAEREREWEGGTFTECLIYFAIQKPVTKKK